MVVGAFLCGYYDDASLFSECFRVVHMYTLIMPVHAMTRYCLYGGSVACWTQAQKARVQMAVATLSGNSLRQTVHTRRASVHQAAKLVAALLRVTGVTAGLAESNGSLPPGL